MLFHQTFRSCSLNKSTPLVFIHGFLGSHLDWIPMIDILQKQYPCIAIDLPAHGNSPFSKDVFSSLEQTLLSLPFQKLWIIGYSLGGRLALAYGQKHPNKPQGLISFSAHTGLKTSDQREKRKENDLLWEDRLKNLPPDEFLKLWYSQSVFSSLQKKTKLLEEIFTRRKYKNPEELALLLREVSLAKQPLYQTFQHPIYFVYGDEDETYKNLYSTHPRHLVKTIKNAGHTVHLENPTSCIETIQDWIKK